MHYAVEFNVAEDRRGQPLVRAIPQPVFHLFQLLEVWPGSARRHLADQVRANRQIHCDVLAGINSLLQVSLPAAQVIHPTGDLITMFAHAVDLEFCAPTVIAQRPHRQLRPFRCALGSMQQHRGDGIVTVGEHIGFDTHGVARNSLDSKAPAVNLRCNFFDDDAQSFILNRRDRPFGAGDPGKFCARCRHRDKMWQNACPAAPRAALITLARSASEW